MSISRIMMACLTAAAVACSSVSAGASDALKRSPFNSVAIPYGGLSTLSAVSAASADESAGTSMVDGEIKPGASVRSVMEIVNRSVNRAIAYSSDEDIYGVNDFWAPPSVTAQIGRGDCEDYALLKLAMLASAGFDAHHLHIVIVRDTRRDVFHAVLAVGVRDTFFILDNVTDAILMDSQISHYQPLLMLSAGRGFLLGTRPAVTEIAGLSMAEFLERTQ